MSLSGGKRLGPYEIVASIGAGAMGEVYRARDTRLNRDVAVKVLPSSFAVDDDRVRRFRLEAQSAGSLNHPNILAIYDIGSHEGSPYIVSELLEGDSLRARLSGGKLSVQKAVDYARQIASGLAAAHAKGITHRDVKPENLFLTKDGRIKILDFGLAKVTQSPGVAEATRSLETTPGAVLGTAAYMSPEQVRGQAADSRSDIFSFGCVLYEMLAGRRTFLGETSAETMTAILKEEPPELPSLDTALPPALDRIVRHCLEKSPDERFQSARDVAFALEAISQISQSGAGGKAISQPAPRSRRWPRLAFAVLLVSVLLAGGGGYFFGARRAAPALQFHRLTYRRGRIQEARFAPDGHTIVYSAAWDDDPIQLFTIREYGPDSRPMGFPKMGLFGISSTGELALALDWKSPSTFEDEGTLARAPFAGGSPRPLLNGVRAADWTPDGSELLVLRPEVKGQQIELPAGKVIYIGPSAGYLSEPRISPDGQRVAFLEHPTGNSDGYLVILDRDGRNRVATAPFGGNAQGVAWSPSGEEVWFTAAKTGARNEMWASDLKGRPRLVSSQVVSLVLQDISRDGRVLCISMKDWRSKILFSAAGESRERELSGLDWSIPRDISPDGKLITFDESGEGAGADPAAYIRETSGAPAVKLGSGVYPVLSADGQLVLATDVSASSVLVFPVGPGETRRIPLKNFVINRLYWFPNGKEVVLSANEPGRGPRLYRISLDGGAPRAFTPEGVFAARTGLSPDAKYIPGTDARSGNLLLYPIDEGAPRPIPGILPGELISSWNTDGRALYVFQSSGFPVRVYRVDIQSGSRELVKEIVPSDRAGLSSAFNIRVTPDGKSFVFSAPQNLGELHLIEGLR